MLALSPPLFSTFGWPFEDSTSHEQNYNYRGTETSESFLHFPSTQPQIGVSESTVLSVRNGDSTMVKKLNHNASERDRRKRINNLYSTLRSLLPAADHKKKLSIPATVTRVLKYIPELQKEVEKLVKKKEELLSRISRQADLGVPERQRKVAFRSTLSAVSASRLGDGEVVSQISTVNDNNNIPLSEVLLNLEEDGLLLLNSSSFQSSGGKIFHNLHLQVQGSQKMEPEMLREKLLSLYEKREELFP
ncbi:hypothetical protein F0562_017489 [Nyssa sinensis]|uniref:BHLH domain-containing protein n=1 Tax=Nyssa sinensis TaxID=561372 RepID=A0A5J4ZGW3_9ASTE|nr:hypothetical protein F0562_017489 [Nyssa sinensis]